MGLFRFLPANSDDEIRLEMFAWSLPDAPSEKAISYTLGDVDMTIIKVNGSTLDVRASLQGPK